ncbi:serine hydrolase domain-containing protein [Oricola thermophila]|uniref:Beta-lactamase family protein n=1 Tax=Oricola thermophila TaxID=2742145 RepID=A0A6N1VE76_9HYPH|nr:serine hydrolase domain-containing protein [Oricola thermophila]QKV17522.1 beta-lactamase family protein [Oricola thermophila]
MNGRHMYPEQTPRTRNFLAFFHRLLRPAAAALALAAFPGLAGTPAAPAGDENIGTLAANLRTRVPARMEADGVAGAVIVVLRDGVPAWSTAFGIADPATGQMMVADMLFRVESLSKPVTAWGAMRLAETGRLDLDAPISGCLSRWVPPSGTKPFTVRQLLSHTAGIGLGDYAARYDPAGPRPDLARFLDADFAQPGDPGSGFAYSDTGFALLELVMEDCTGEDFSLMMKREVLQPLGMEQASFEWTGAGMPVGHDLHGRTVAPYVYPARASGGLLATATDIARFAAAGMAEAAQPVLSAQGVEELHAPAVEVGGLFGFAAEAYGLGHFVETLSDGRRAVWHGGQGHGWMTHLHMVPETGDGIVILANSQRAWPLFADVLRTWSQSLGVAPVGMTRVLLAETAARFAIAALVLGGIAAAWAAWRRPAGRMSRIAAGVFALPLVCLPAWAATRDYLFLFSILPGLWPWLAAASCVAGAGLAAIAAAPEPRKAKRRG